MKRLIACASLFVAVAVAGCSQQQAKTVETSVFTSEEVACMVAGLLAGTMSGDAATVAGQIEQVCQIAPALTTDVVNFVNVFVAASPTEKARWAKWSAAHKSARHPHKK